MQYVTRYSLPAAAVLVLTLWTVSFGPRLLQRAAMQRALNNWDIHKLADHLNRAGLKVRLCSPRKDGTITQFAYLTTIDKSWEDLNLLPKDDRLSVQRWRGVVYCERMNKHWELVFDHRDEHFMAAGPFVFYGDPELMERIHGILLHSASSGADRGERVTAFCRAVAAAGGNLPTAAAERVLLARCCWGGSLRW